MKTYTLVVLDDGETYSLIEGASILVVTEEGMDEIGTGKGIVDLSDKHILSEVQLKGFYTNAN